MSRRQTLLLSIATLALASTACSGKADKGVDERPDVDEMPWEHRWTGAFTARIPTASPAEAMELCMGLAAATDGLWKGTPLFAVDAEDARQTAGDVKDNADLYESELGRFCRVEAGTEGALEMGDRETDALVAWATKAAGGEDDTAIELTAEVPDVVYFQTPTVVDAHSIRTLSLVGVQRPLLAGDSDGPDVRVIVADSEPSGPYVPASTAGFDDHGRRTAGIIYNLLCGASTPTNRCGVELRNELALPFRVDATTKRSRDQATSGGAFGTHNTLSRAIRRSTDYVRRQGDARPTILNLSLGWNSARSTRVNLTTLRAETSPAARKKLLGTPARRTPSISTAYAKLAPGEQAVMAALVEARCQGILPIAATGNRTNHPTPTTTMQQGALYPAAWMDLSVKSIALSTTGDPCTELGFGGSWDPARPLVYAVSGVDQGYHPADLGRPRSESPLAALAVGVTVDDPTGTADHMVVSGTSAAAAVATAATALAWSADVTKSGDDRVREVYAAGTTSTDATSGAPIKPVVGATAFGVSEPQRVVRLCETAVQTKHPKTPASCTAVTLSDFEPSSPTSVTDTSGATVHDCKSPSTGSPCLGKYPPTADVLEKVWPQPINDGCPSCDLEIMSGAGNPLEGNLTLQVPGQRPFWRTDRWTDKHDLLEVTLEVVDMGDDMHIVEYGPGTGVDLFMQGGPDSFPVEVGTPIDPRSAMLVITGMNLELGVVRSWNVPVPLSAN